jgi:SAM-dependent methyltransferase
MRTGLGESKHYEGAAGAKYFDWQNRNGEITGKIEARKFQAYIAGTDSVLDFGCGAGHILRNLNCYKRVGIEINPAARTIAAASGIECYASIADVGDSRFDVVISNHALEHVMFPISVLKSLVDKVKPSGILLLCVPIDDWRRQRKYDPDDINHHLHTWTPQLLGNCLLEAGLAPKQFSIQVFTHAWFPGTTRVFGKIPNFLFDSLCQAFAVITRRRQLLAVAKNVANL